MVEDEMEGEVLKVGANSKGSMINPLQIRTVSSSSKDEKILMKKIRLIEVNPRV